MVDRWLDDLSGIADRMKTGTFLRVLNERTPHASSKCNKPRRKRRGDRQPEDIQMGSDQFTPRLSFHTQHGALMTTLSSTKVNTHTTILEQVQQCAPKALPKFFFWVQRREPQPPSHTGEQLTTVPFSTNIDALRAKFCACTWLPQKLCISSHIMRLPLPLTLWKSK